MTKKRTIKKMPALKWKKQRGSFTYEIVDPITGGLWMFAAPRAMADDELFSQVHHLMGFCGVERPKLGQTWLFEVFG